MTQAQADRAWQKYVSACWCGGTREERRHAFDVWWRYERAESLEQHRRDKRKFRNPVR